MLTGEEITSARLSTINVVYCVGGVEIQIEVLVIKSVYCQYGQYSLTFRALALCQTKTNASRNVRLYYPYWQYTDLFKYYKLFLKQQVGVFRIKESFMETHVLQTTATRDPTYCVQYISIHIVVSERSSMETTDDHYTTILCKKNKNLLQYLQTIIF